MGEAADGPTAVETAARLAPDIVAMDIHLPGMDGIACTRRITRPAGAPIVRRAITFAQARDKVKRNVTMLFECPVGQQGTPSKSLMWDQAEPVPTAAEG